MLFTNRNYVAKQFDFENKVLIFVGCFYKEINIYCYFIINFIIHNILKQYIY